MIGRRIIGFLLVAEGVATALWLARLLPTLGWRDRSTVAVILARSAAGALQLTSGWLISSRRAPGIPLARWALFLSAVLTTLELGARLTPSDFDPTYRWPLVIAYGIYASGAIWFLSRSASPSGTVEQPGSPDA